MMETGIPCEGWEGPCKNKNAIRKRQRTQYIDDEKNYATLCPKCWEKNIKYWNDMWAEYYSGCM